MRVLWCVGVDGGWGGLSISIWHIPTMGDGITEGKRVRQLKLMDAMDSNKPLLPFKAPDYGFPIGPLGLQRQRTLNT